MRMRKIGLVMMTTILMLLTVTLMPVVNAEPINKATEQCELEKRFIDSIGEDKYKELKDVATKVSKGILDGSYLYEDLLELLKVIGLVITQLLIVLFGINPLGMFISLLITVIIMVIPVFLLSCIAAIEVFILDFVDTLNIESLGELFEYFGIFGTIVFVVIILPLLLVLSIGVIPLASLVFFTDFMAQILGYVMEEIP